MSCCRLPLRPRDESNVIIFAQLYVNQHRHNLKYFQYKIREWIIHLHSLSDFGGDNITLHPICVIPNKHTILLLDCERLFIPSIPSDSDCLRAAASPVILTPCLVLLGIDCEVAAVATTSCGHRDNDRNRGVVGDPHHGCLENVSENLRDA